MCSTRRSGEWHEATVPDAFGRPRARAGSSCRTGRRSSRRPRRSRSIRLGSTRARVEPRARRADRSRPGAASRCSSARRHGDRRRRCRPARGARASCRRRPACLRRATCRCATRARLFGPQKGATPEQVAELEARCRDATSSRPTPDLPGAGAAGGLGAALASLGAELVPGAELVLDALGFDPCGVRPRRHRRGHGRRDDAEGKAPAESRAAAARRASAASSSAAAWSSRCPASRRSRSRATRRGPRTTSSS